MAVRIRVFPQYGGAAGYGGYGGYGAQGMVQNRLLSQQLANQKRTSALRLNYERALMAERLKLVQLQAQLQYGGGYGYGGAGAMPYGAAMMGASGANFFGSLMPALAGGMGGQTNITNQNAMGSANQTVTNNNTLHRSSYAMGPSPFASGGFGFPFGSSAGYGYGSGSGGLFGGLLGGLI